MADDLFQLDLCVLAYQLHAQTLYWPLDPYCEQMRFKSASRTGVDWSVKRNYFLQAVRLHLNEHFNKNRQPRNLLLRGPGFVNGTPANDWQDNAKLDPILYRYDRISPHVPGYSRPNKDDEKFLIYSAPQSITDQMIWAILFSVLFAVLAAVVMALVFAVLVAVAWKLRRARFPRRNGFRG